MTCSSVVKALGEWKWHVWRLQSGCLLCDTFDEGIKWQCADNVLEALNIILPVLLRSCYLYACDKPTPVQITGIGGSSDLIKSALFIRVSLGEAVKWRLKWPEEWCCDFTRWIIWPNGIPTAAPGGQNTTSHNIWRTFQVGEKVGHHFLFVIWRNRSHRRHFDVVPGPIMCCSQQCPCMNSNRVWKDGRADAEVTCWIVATPSNLPLLKCAFRVPRGILTTWFDESISRIIL